MDTGSSSRRPPTIRWTPTRPLMQALLENEALAAQAAEIGQALLDACSLRRAAIAARMRGSFHAAYQRIQRFPRRADPRPALKLTPLNDSVEERRLSSPSRRAIGFKQGNCPQFPKRAAARTAQVHAGPPAPTSVRSRTSDRPPVGFFGAQAGFGRPARWYHADEGSEQASGLAFKGIEKLPAER